MPNSPRATAPLRLGIATWIAGVSLLALMPMLAFSAFVVDRQLAEQQQQAAVALQRRAIVAAAAIGHELDSLFAELKAMSQADSVRQGDLAATHALARRVVTSEPRFLSIGLVGTRGEPLLSTDVPFGPAPPPGVAVVPGRPVFEVGARSVSPLVREPASQRPVVGLLAPLYLGSVGDFALRAVVNLRSIGERLNEQAWPDDWTAAVLDQNQVILARSRDAAQFVGQPATETLQAGLRGGQAIFRAITKDGFESVVSAAMVPGTGWRVVVGRPLGALNAQVRDSMLSILVAGVLCSVLGVGGALVLARLLGRQLNAVVAAHADGGAGRAPDSRIREVSALSEALTQARVSMVRTSGELHDAREEVLARLNERSEMLDVLAHEVRQPLNNASAALQAASVVLAGGADHTAAEPLRRAASVLGEVQAGIDNTLAAAALLVADERVAREDVDIDALIAVAVADLPAGEGGRVHVERLTSTRTASMDAGLMRLALRNLLANALKYSRPGSAVVLRVGDSDEPLALLLDVVDQGPGIGQERLGRLFDRADRGPAGAGTRRQGLGLFIVRRVMERHGGEVRLVRNGPGGATMRLVIDQRGDD